MFTRVQVIKHCLKTQVNLEVLKVFQIIDLAHGYYSIQSVN